jgi:hypothetical protein
MLKWPPGNDQRKINDNAGQSRFHGTRCRSCRHLDAKLHDVTDIESWVPIEIEGDHGRVTSLNTCCGDTTRAG